MKKLFLAAVAVLISTAALAADNLPVKAPAYVAPCQSSASCSGWYFDFGIIGQGTNADIVGQGLSNSIFSDGIGILGGGGYQLWTGALFAGIQVNGGYEFASSVVGLGHHGSFVGTELVQLGYNFFPNAGTATTAPGQAPTQLLVPANLLASTTPYFNVGGMQVHGISEGVMGAGVQTVIASGWSSSADYLYAPSQQGQKADQVVTLKLMKHF